MGGGLMQLVAYGAQDIYLTGQPQITFFKSVYRRHTNFSIESILQTINGTSSPGSRVSVTISRNGDLLKNLWVQYNPNSFITGAVLYPAADFGHALFDQLELEIGGQLIDRQYGKWLTIWRDLSEVNPIGSQGCIQALGAEPDVHDDQVDASGVFVTPSTRYQRMAYTHRGRIPAGTSVANLTGAPTEAYVPMKFWFCKNPGLAVPLIALQYHEVKFNITFAAAAKIAAVASGTAVYAGYSTVQVYADYVYLDTTERRQFAQNAHEYLIDQLQVQSDTANGGTIRLNFNHPVKELIWTGSPLDASSNAVNGGATPSEILSEAVVITNVKAKIVLNGTDRFTERNMKYFTRNQVWDCHTGFGATAKPDAVALYSFALRPEEHQPSGTCNFSRIDTAQLVFTNLGEVTLKPLDIYAVNYNVLRIMSGMGGLAYSN